MVWQSNWAAVTMFIRASTQWRVAASGQLIGLDYQAIESLFRIYRVRSKRKLLEEIQIIEAGAIAAQARRIEKAGKSGV